MIAMLSAGEERFKSDKRQLGGLMLVLGAAALVFPQAGLAGALGPIGTNPTEGIPLSAVCAAVIVITMGVLGMVTGYLSLVHDTGHKYLTGFLLLFTQLAYVPFITDLTAVGRGARSGAAFIPEAYDPTATDVRFVGAMGMMGILGYGTGFLGSLAFVEFALHAYQSGKPEARPGSYYRGRMSFYTFVILLVGVAQALLGIYTLITFGNGPLENGAIVVAMFHVNFPELSVFVGLVQVVVALFGFVRYFGWMNGERDHTFQVAVLFQWMCMLSMQILTQIAYSPGGIAAGAAPSVTMLTLGINVLPAYLDFKMRTTPESLPADYYGAQGAKHDETLVNSWSAPDP